MNVGFKFQPTDPDRAITDMIRILDAETGTEWIRVSAYKATGVGGYPLTIPVPPGRYTLEWAHRRSEKWYTIVKDFEYDAKTLVNVKF